MTTTLADLQQVYTRRSIALLRHMLLMPSLTNRNYEGEARRGQTVKIWVYDSDNQTLGKGAASPALPTVGTLPTGNDEVVAAFAASANRDGGAYTDLHINRTIAESWFDPFLSDLYRPGTVNHTARYLAARMARTLDGDIFEQMWAKITAISGQPTVLNAVDGVYINDDGTGDAGNVDPGKLVFDAIESFGDYCDLNGFGVDALNQPMVKYFVIDSPTWRAVRTYVRGQNWSDRINEDIIRNAAMFAPGVRNQLRAVIGGVNVLVSNLIPFGTGAAGGANAGDSERRFIAGTAAAFTVAVADMTTVVWPRGRNPKGDGSTAGRNRDGTLIEFLEYHGMEMVDSRQLRAYTIRGAAAGGAN